jgi:phosphatidate cytidylyltransferase
VLIQRVITALVLLPFVLGVLWFGSTDLVGLVFGAVVLVAVYEWAALTLRRSTAGRPNDRQARVTYTLVAALLIFAVVSLRDTPVVWAMVAATCLWWLLMLRWISQYPAGFGERYPPRWIKAGAGLLVIPGTIGAVTLLHGATDGPWRLMFALFLVWAADVGAYFAGRGFGRHKLAPEVSPGKTWEGVAGGVGLSLLIVAIGGTWLFHLQGRAWIPFALMCVAIVLISVVGDLGESLLKRQAGAKDSGTLLPGHGGLLDRIDSLLAALPALALGLRWLQL